MTERRSRSLCRFFAFLGMALACTLAAHAFENRPRPAIDPHHVDGSSVGGTIDLTSTWLLQQGDDPSFASPSLDDSHWLVVSAGKPLASYGLKQVDFVWYRTHVTVPPSAHSLALLLRGFAGSDQVFVNGEEIASSGPFPPGGSMTDFASDIVYSIPASALEAGPEPGQLTIAIRGSIGRYSFSGERPGGLIDSSAVLLGSPAELADAASLHAFRGFTSNFTNLLLASIVLLIAVALVLTLPSDREYVALSCYMLSVVCTQAGLITMFRLNMQPNFGIVLVEVALNIVQAVSLLEFVRIVLGLRRSRLFLWYEAALVTIAFSAETWYISQLYLSAGGIAKAPLATLIELTIVLLSMPINLGLPALALWVWWKRRNTDALLLLVPLLFQSGFRYYGFAIALLAHIHVIQSDSIGAPPIPWLQVQWAEVSVFLYNVTLLVFLILRTVRIARARAESAAEIRAAQTVQQVLLARASQPTPGFRVESVYLPANEVGGDFFLVSPGPDGSLTAIVGDVSGKGLIAAMRVSMILGVLSREESRTPHRILYALNEALLNQGEMGFTTACCVLMHRDGSYTIANAGHISPYVDGMEIVAPPSLPLGLAPGQEFAESSGDLPLGKKLVLMSDGVVEARSATGELYGFDRLPALTHMPARDIADVAQRFGQDDDITVLTIACEA